jgi:mannose-6-phosphate isomerase-like protein (cupin superfamily)
VAHHVTRFDPASLTVPRGYDKSSTGYRTCPLVTAAHGSVHLSKGICELAPDGAVLTHVQQYEEAFYVLAGKVQLMLADRWYELSAGHYGFIPIGVTHTWINAGDEAARWLEICAPQRLEDGRQDTFFVGSEPERPGEVAAPDFADPRTRWLGSWTSDTSQRANQQLVGLQGGMDIAMLDVGKGNYIKKLVDNTLGAYLIQVIMGDMHGLGHRDNWESIWHDHTFEETFFFLEGEMEGYIDGKQYHLTAGDCGWVGVGAPHTWRATTDRVVFIEAQIPQPPIRHIYRQVTPWNHLAEKLGAADRDGNAPAKKG